MSDGKLTEVTYLRLLPGQQLQFDEAMTKELSQVLAANAVRRLSQEEELTIKPERLLRMRWVLTWKYTEGETGRQRRGWSFWGISIQSLQVYQLLHRHWERCLVICYFKHAHCTNFVSMLVMSPRRSCKHRPSEEHQELTIKAPPEVGYFFSDSEGKPARYVRLMKSFYGLTSAPRVWWLDITQKLSQLGWKPMSTDQCLWGRYSDDGELKGVIGIHINDLLIGLADGMLGEKWMSEIKSLYRW